MKCAPALNARHKQTCINWATADVTQRPCNWKSIAVSNEKKFDSAGPGMFLCYCHNIRKEERIFAKLQGGGYF